MPLTTAQITTLATDIQTHPELEQYWLGPANDNVAIKDYYNAPDSTNADCWRTSMTLADVLTVMNWTIFIGRSQGERDAFRMMFMIGPINPSLPNIQAAFNDIFSGATAAALRAALAGAGKRKMTRIERLLATNVSGTFVLSFEGAVTSVEASAAIALIPGA